ncbi:MAG: MOSC domain-containing protein [Lachnospiraceae bacterium]|nr:MOSC domain-containing protein [Lachnospiraceae bacterium]
MAEILAVCISERKGTLKHPAEEIRLIPEHGIEGGAHAGKWHRQVSLLARESVETMEERLKVALAPGVFAENVLTRGIELKSLPIGTRLRIGTALAEVTQIGKECHADCEIRRKTGDCVMPREGIFVRILEEGTARAGDTVAVAE